MKTLIILLLLTVSAAHAMVVGSDSRVPFTNQPSPMNMVGIVHTKRNKVCTGAMVAKNIVLTARHCVEKATGFDFEIPRLGRFTVTHYKLSMATDHRFINDYAFLRIDGEVNEWAGIGLPNQNPIFVAGIDLDFGLNLLINQNGCQLVKTCDRGLLLHDCPTGKGTSGAPLFQRNSLGELVIVGLNVAQAYVGTCPSFNQKDCYNIAVPVEEFYIPMREFTKEQR